LPVAAAAVALIARGGKYAELYNSQFG